jgi:anti-sigma B factor antagonist
LGRFGWIGPKGGQVRAEDELDVQVFVEERVVRLFLRGELDVASAPKLLGYLTDAFATNVPQIVIDMAELAFFGAIGLSLLIAAQKRARSELKSLTFSAPSKQFTKLVEISGLDGFFDLETPLHSSS